MLDPQVPVVVAAAIVRNGCVLAARRRAPAAVAGGWELPGGKVEPVESDIDALVRECREELGIETEVIVRVGDDVPLPPGRVLRAYVGRLAPSSAEPQAGDDHDEIRWLMPEQLDDVAWLPADRPLVEALRGRLLDGDPLPGGNVGGAVRIGPTVRRPGGPWTPTILALLGHVRAQGLSGVPQPSGQDVRGREIVSYLPGETLPTGDGAPWVYDDELLVAVARWLRSYHEAVRTFRPPAARWRLHPGPLGDDEIVCHNDVAPYNIVVSREETSVTLAGVLDWDLAGPGMALDDVAFAAWGFVPLRSPVPAVEAARRLRLLAGSYGGVEAAELLEAVPVRMRRSVERIRGGVAAGDAGMRRLSESGAVDAVERALADLAARMDDIRREIDAAG